MMVSLWLWAAQNATDGDLSKCSDRAIAEAAEYKKKPSAFVAALIKTRWLDEDRHLHDWNEYASLLQDAADRQKANTAERVKRYRERKKNAGVTPDGSPGVTHEPEESDEDVTPCNGYGNVTDTPSNAPTLPNLTLPNQTLPVSTPIRGDTNGIDQGGSIGRTATHGLPHGTKQNVYLTQREYETLVSDFGELNVTFAIIQMGKWLEGQDNPPDPEKHYEILRKKLWKEPTIRAEEQ